MTDFSRRLFLAAAGAAALPMPVRAQRRDENMLIVNALGGLGNPNMTRPSGPPSPARVRSLDPRVLADARASGMDAVNVTMGYVSGDAEPFEQSIRSIGQWDARLRNHADMLLKVLTSADILRARRSGGSESSTASRTRR